MTDNPEISQGGADDAPTLYPYAGIPLSPNGISALILELFAGKTVERQEIVDLVLRTHLERGGAQPRAADFPRSVKKALENLKRDRIVSNPAFGFWQIQASEPGEENEEFDSLDSIPTTEDLESEELTSAAEIVLGQGRSAVYVYYYSAYRDSALYKGDAEWPCKIGRTDRDPLNRVISQAATALPEYPHMAIIFWTDSPSKWESLLHNVLSIRGKAMSQAPGREWFMTSIDEIISIINFVMVSHSATESVTV
jgi:hypothetical protein